MLVNNASAPVSAWRRDGALGRYSSDRFLGALYATRHGIEAMRRAGGGTIMNIASISGLWHGRQTFLLLQEERQRMTQQKLP